MIKSTRDYAYINALVRGKLGNLLKPYDYEAVLGCNKPSDIAQVLSSSSYAELLTRSRTDSFAAIDETVSSAASQNATNLIAASPDLARTVLNEYRLSLESRSLVNSLRFQINPDDIAVGAGAIPLGAIPKTYYELTLAAAGGEYSKTFSDPGLSRAVAESLQAARRYRSTAPLLRIIIYLCERFLDRKPDGAHEEKASLERLVISNIDGANLEVILTGLHHGMEQQTVEASLLSQRGSLGDESLLAALNLRDIEQLLASFSNSRYRSCLELKSGETVDDLLVRLPYCIMLQESHYALAGYPFKASTVAVGITLKLLEVRNLRLAIAGASGRLGRAFAFRLMIIP